MSKIAFRECTQAKLEALFGLRSLLDSTVLDSWLQTQLTLSEQEKMSLKVFQEELLLNDEAWNEHELSMHFIGPILSMARFTERYRFKLFSQREIGTIVTGLTEEIELNGKPDGIIATGFWEPKIPMFAFSEYKRELDGDGDPAGQALAAMLVGQTLNQALNKEPIPIYGCYVIGHSWRFLVLEDKHYTISPHFLASTEQIYDIFRILKALKLIIMELTA